MAYRLLLPLSCVFLITACPAKEDEVPDDSSSGSTSEAASASDTGATGPATSEIEATMGPETGPDTTTSTSGPVQTSGPEVTSDGTEDSGATETEGDTEQVPEECQLPSKTYDAFVTGPESVSVDEPCIVAASQVVADTLELAFLCPTAGVVQLTVTGGPLPAVQVGETLDVFYQPEFIEPIEFPAMGLLFLRSGDQLRYGAATGFLWLTGLGMDADRLAIAAGLAPLTLGVEMGPCPLVKNFEGDEPWGGDDWTCNYEALALIRLAFGDEALVQGEGTSGVLAAGADSYALDVRFARRGEQCIDYSLDRIAVAVALQSP
ncbi:MAG TPA: hypothetical protein VGB85_15175 [Nannocystis sp.]